VTEWVKGKTLDEAAALKNSQIAEELALPPKVHCSILAEDAIKAAVNDYRAKHTPLRKPEMAITLTEAAARHVNRYLTRRGKGIGVRLGVKTTGCSGLAYKLEYVDEVEPEDIVFESHGVKVLIDPRAWPTSTAPSWISCAKVSSSTTPTSVIAAAVARASASDAL
jgi:hypothetical protein